MAEVNDIAPGVPVRVLSARDGTGLESLRPLLEPGKTVALIGSSGVGKSTIVNALLGWERQATGEVREDDQRGRHTTTVRELVVTDSGALLIDSPGMRSVGMWDVDEGLADAFADVEAFAAECRFTDCAHGASPAAPCWRQSPMDVCHWHGSRASASWVARRPSRHVVRMHCCGPPSAGSGRRFTSRCATT